MAIEIERKFLVAGDGWREGAPPAAIRQGYLLAAADKSVRVRRIGGRAYITVKGASQGASRAEFEYEIPVADADEMIASLCTQPVLSKRRYTRLHEGLAWEIDEFEGALAGLILAEVELPAVDTHLPLPPWAGREVTEDARFYNSNLSKCTAPPE